jgi:hypothetical protein
MFPNAKYQPFEGMKHSGLQNYVNGGEPERVAVELLRFLLDVKARS